MSSEVLVLAGTAASIGFIHTLLGPDHYLPFIAMSKARGWSGRKTALITFLCGIGHVLGSIILGLAGVFVGIVVFKLESIEAVRGDIAGWLLIAFGFLYMAWGIRRAVRNRAHEHSHVHQDGEIHTHGHTHFREHAHVHDQKKRANITPWILFTIFVFGPCEPLIPLLMYPAATSSPGTLVIVTLVFAVTTIGTMLGAVMLCYKGLSFIRLPRIERYGHALAGFTMLMCGGAIKFLGL